MNKELLIKMIDEKLVSVQKHPTADLFLYNYTARVQYSQIWNEVTLQTRGLILDSEMNVVARPFNKFFNYEELDPNEMPNLPFDVFEKVDGSLGILYWIDDLPFIATRGSFESEQAKHATNILRTKYKHAKLSKNKTYLFEIIYPENRIVVDYGELDDLILLSIIDNKTGVESSEDVGFPIVKKYNGLTDLKEIRKLNEPNKEGFVVRFSNGFRLKLKYADYVRLHKTITGVSNITIWEYLKENKPLDEILEKVPDEFYNWVRRTRQELLSSFDYILNECKSVFEQKQFQTRKEAALYFKVHKYSSVLFKMFDGKCPNESIWKLIRPKHTKAFF